MRVVLDTSALVSAIRSSTGASAEIVRLILLGRLALLLDYKLTSEYRSVALRPEHIQASRRTQSEIEEIIDALEAVASPVLVDIMHRPLSSDEDDDMVLDVAVNGEAEAIITHNVRHFMTPASEFHIGVFTPGDFLAGIRKGGA